MGTCFFIGSPEHVYTCFNKDNIMIYYGRDNICIHGCMVDIKDGTKYCDGPNGHVINDCKFEPW